MKNNSRNRKLIKIRHSNLVVTRGFLDYVKVSAEANRCAPELVDEIMTRTPIINISKKYKYFKLVKHETRLEDDDFAKNLVTIKRTFKVLIKPN